MTVKFVHIHIPKTAGTSVTSCMKAMFGNSRVIHFGRRERVALFKEMSPEQLSGYQCIGGHIYYGAFLKKIGPRPLYFTILREPVDRFISFYSDVFYRETHPLHHIARGMSAIEFLKASIAENYILPQTAYVSRNKSLKSAMHLIRSKKIYAQSLENHDSLLRFIASKAGKEPALLPRKNKSKRDLPVEMDELDRLIRRAFEDDFKLFEFTNSDQNALPSF